MTYAKPKIDILGKAAQLIKGLRGGSGEPIDNKLGPLDCEFGD